MIVYKKDSPKEISESEMILLERAETLPVVYDEDSPELTPAMKEAFRAARKKKPRKNAEGAGAAVSA